MDRYAAKLTYMLVGVFAGTLAGVYVHELGHQAACLYLGYESGGITISVLESYHVCVFGGQASGADVLAVLAAGGGLATAVFGTALAVLLSAERVRGAARRGDFAFYFVLAGFATQSVNLVMEAGFTALYDDTARTLGAACGLFLVFCIWYVQLPKHGSDHRWLGRIRRPLT